jgi:hypothetical protein
MPALVVTNLHAVLHRALSPVHLAGLHCHEGVEPSALPFAHQERPGLARQRRRPTAMIVPMR